MSNTQPTPDTGLYAYPFGQLMAIRRFVNNESDAAFKDATLIDEAIWMHIQTEEGKRLVKEWCDLHKLDLLQLGACPPDEAWSPDDVANLTRRARKLFENLSFRVRVVQKIGKSAARYSTQRGE